MRLCICQIIFGKNLHNSVEKQKNSDYPWRQLAKMRFNMVIWTHKSFFCHSHVKTTGVKGHRAYAQPQIGSQLLKQGTCKSPNAWCTSDVLRMNYRQWKPFFLSHADIQKCTLPSIAIKRPTCSPSGEPAFGANTPLGLFLSNSWPCIRYWV